MPELTDIVGIGLAGGQGVRARPLTLKAPGYLRSKAAMSFLGRRLIRWVIQILSSEGIKEYYVIAHGKENRYQIKVMLGYGEELRRRREVLAGEVRRACPREAPTRRFACWSTGTFGSTRWSFPTDSIIDFDLDADGASRTARVGAVATIAAMTRPPDEVAEKYGVMLPTTTGGSPTSSRSRRSPSCGSTSTSTTTRSSASCR